MINSTSKNSWRVFAHHQLSTGLSSDQIRLGVLLGAGSYGRVYKGRWQGQDVAVKVMQHDGHTAARVINEVALVMSFKHPNIVQAFDFITWTHCGHRAERRNSNEERTASGQLVRRLSAFGFEKG